MSAPTLSQRGNSASGGAVAPPLLPAPFAFVSQWLPSGATVTALRNAVYFPTCQHAQPIAVLATWATAIFAAKLQVSHRLGRSREIPELLTSSGVDSIVLVDDLLLVHEPYRSSHGSPRIRTRPQPA